MVGVDTFGGIIRRWRGPTSQTIAAQQLSAKAGRRYTQQDISRWEKGGGTDDDQAIAAIAALADLPLEDVRTAARPAATLEALATELAAVRAEVAAFRALFDEDAAARIAVGQAMLDTLTKLAEAQELDPPSAPERRPAQRSRRGPRQAAPPM
jgi:hypothetical protein